MDLAIVEWTGPGADHPNRGDMPRLLNLVGEWMEADGEGMSFSERQRLD